MPLVDKGELIKTLRAFSAFENGSPYIAVYIDGPAFYRSSPFGFIHTTNTNLTARSTCVSLAQFLDRLRILGEDQVDIDVDPNGILRINSINHTWDNELRVHTVKYEQAGLKTHTIGAVKLRLDPKIFAGFSSKPFTVVSFPTLKNGKVMLPTVHGIVTWQGPPELAKLNLQPRDTFLKFLSPAVTEIYITDQGYWGACTESLLTFVGAHNGSDDLFNFYNIQGTSLVTYPAKRLCEALSAASTIVNGNVEMTAADVKAKDNHGLTSRFGVGGDGTAKFTIYSKTAKLIVDALEQSQEETAVLSNLQTGQHATMRLQRGDWAVNFKVF